jgi:hypothetical protein
VVRYVLTNLERETSMADTTGSSATDRELEVMCLTVQRLLRVAISDWYGYLARQALTDWKWRYEVPWWVKKVPERFDKDWALNDLRAAVDRPGMVASLMTAVDETHLSIDGAVVCITWWL